MSLLPILHLPDLSWKEKVAYLAWKLHEGPATVQPGLAHRFEPGRYIREMSLPAGTVFIGRVHKVGHLLVLLRGKARLISEEGSRDYSAVDMLQTPSGFQTIAYTLTSVLAQTVHANPAELRDIEELEDEIFEAAELTLVRGKEVAMQLQERLT